ncbi:MAG: helix-turn-helix transcriptional regulator [Lachnospiraceae bacterium]|nr:helix-turn-helix transcriptional regulator [Lachnospiraceae bacterium]
MRHTNDNYGNLYLRINDILKAKGISKNQICKDLDIPRSNFNRYCRDDFQRIDAVLICKLCWYLNVEAGELIKYKHSDDSDPSQF